jgi:geranylgeranyl pyrophosphate synthase
MATKTTKSTDIESFKKKLAEYKKLIDADINKYARAIEHTTLKVYGKQARVATDAYLSILTRGGKRIRGALVMTGYEMSGGTDREMILQAARAIEMVHAYILIIDDIQDRSLTRRGGPAAHVMLADYHRQQQLADDSAHYGTAIAINAALSGMHAAQMILANLIADEELRLKVISILNRTMLITAHGQTADVTNEMTASVDEADVDRVMEWKTANYTFLNPLHVGMVLAGADCDATDAITDYAKHAGRAFQITDDILGIFGTEFESGKSPLDDIKEGKRTLLTVYALKHANNADKNFLIQMLGNHNLTQAEFARCKDILIECGAFEYARKEAGKHVTAASKSLKEKSNGFWNPDGLKFLNGLAEYLLIRQT